MPKGLRWLRLIKEQRYNALQKLYEDWRKDYPHEVWVDFKYSTRPELNPTMLDRLEIFKDDFVKLPWPHLRESVFMFKNEYDLGKLMAIMEDMNVKQRRK